MNRHRCVLPPFGAHTPASRILRMSASGTGSGRSRRIARVECMISKRSLSEAVMPGPPWSELTSARLAADALREIGTALGAVRAIVDPGLALELGEGHALIEPAQLVGVVRHVPGHQDLPRPRRRGLVDARVKQDARGAV